MNSCHCLLIWISYADHKCLQLFTSLAFSSHIPWSRCFFSISICLFVLRLCVWDASGWSMITKCYNQIHSGSGLICIVLFLFPSYQNCIYLGEILCFRVYSFILNAYAWQQQRDDIRFVYTAYPKKLCTWLALCCGFFVVRLFIHILQGSFMRNGVIKALPQRRWINSQGYE